MQNPAPAPGISGVSAPDREVRSRGSGRAPDRRQLLLTQARQGACLAGAATPLPRALHAHLRLLAESGGALVSSDHPACDPAGQLLQRQGADRQDCAVCGRLQQEQSPVQLDGDGRFNPGEAPSISLANLQDGTSDLKN